MGTVLKKFTLISLLAGLAGLWCGAALAAEDFARHANFIAEDAQRDIVSTLHSRLDAFRKIREPAPRILQLNTPSAEVEGFTTLSPASTPAEGGTADAGTVDAAYGSLAAPTINYGDRYLNRFWGGGLGSWQKMNARGDITGYKYDSQGVILGFDRAHGPMTFGLAASYIKGEYENTYTKTHDSEIKHYSGHAHFTYNNSRGFFFTVLGGYTYSDSDISEKNGAESLLEDYGTHTWNAGGKVGFDFEPGPSTVITPSIGVNFFHSRSSAHDALRDGVRNERLGKMKHSVVEIPLDIAVAHEMEFGRNRLLQLSANGGYAYNLNNKAVSGDIDAEHYVGRKLGRSAWHLGAGARFKVDQWDMGVEYDFYKRSAYTSHRVMGTVGFSF